MVERATTGFKRRGVSSGETGKSTGEVIRPGITVEQELIFPLPDLEEVISPEKTLNGGSIKPLDAERIRRSGIRRWLTGDY